MNQSLRIVYIGTPDFAVEPLKVLVENNKNVVAVMTAPDKPAGRGHKLQASPVKEFALKYNIPVLQPSNMKDPSFIEELKSYKADLQIVVAFRMMPEVVWNMPQLGTFNLHASLLPQYRGAAPINWAIINGEKETGNTTFFLKHEIDTGNILFQEKISISDEDTAGTLHDKLMLHGGQLVLKTVNGIEQNNIKEIPQDSISDSGELKKAPKIFKEHCNIDWNKSGKDVHNLIRGMSPFPCCFTHLNDGNENTLLKIQKSKFESATHTSEVGTIIVEPKQSVKICTKDGYIYIVEAQLPGKQKMSIKDLMNGNDFSKYKKALYI